jgi:hypothetical protein
MKFHIYLIINEKHFWQANWKGANCKRGEKATDQEIDAEENFSDE